MQDESETSRLTFELLGKAWNKTFYFYSYTIMTIFVSVSGSERIIVSCPSKEERLRLIELLQKQIRNPTISSSSSSAVSCVSRPPFRLMTRYLALLIKAGLLTRLRLREILDGGKAEHERRLILGCAFISPSANVETINLNRFLRQCRAECHLPTGQSQRSSTQTRSLYIEKEFTMGVPFTVRSRSRSSASSTSSSTCTSSSSSSSSSSPLISGATNLKSHWSPKTRTHGGFSGSLDCSSFLSPKSPRFPSRSQSLPPPLDLCITRFCFKEPSAERAEGPVQRYYASTTAGAWVSNVSFDSGLADVGGATSSQSRDATGTPSESDTASNSSPVAPVYRSTLYAHWWRKAKVSAAVLLAQSPTPPFPSLHFPTGKGDGT